MLGSREDGAVRQPGLTAVERWRGRVPMIVFLGLAVWLLYRSHVYRGPKMLDVAELGLVDLNGAPIPGAALAGRPIVLNFWAPWCGPCRVETPWLEALQREHPEIVVIGVEDDPGAMDSARAMAAEEHISYPLAAMSGEVSRRFSDISTLPTTLYIRGDGRVVHTVTGVVPESVMRYYLRDALVGVR